MNKSLKSAPLTVFFMIVAMLISKLLGMFRGVLLAASYGTTENATAFYAASRIPLSFFDMVFASAILGCFIPVYNSFKGENKREEQNEFTSIYLNFLLLLTGIFTILGVIFAPQLLDIVAPGLLPETKDLAVLLLRVMFPLVVFAASSYTLVGVLQSNDEYIVPAFISAVSNVLIILYFLFFDSRFGIKGLALTHSFAWFAQLLTLVVPVYKKRYKYQFNFDFKNKAFLTALKLTPSIMMGSWLAPVCMLLSMRFATYISVQGVIPAFEYAMNLFTVITGITTYGVCNYVFPKLSTQADSENADFAKTGRIGLLSALLMTVPISSIVLALAPEGIAIVYLRGSFDTNSAEMVTLLLRTLVPGMIGFTLIEFLSRTFYAIKKPKYVVFSAVLGILTNFVTLLFTAKIYQFGIVALGISYSVGILTAGLSMVVLSAIYIKGLLDFGYVLNLLKILLSGIVTTLVMLTIKNAFNIDAFVKSFIFNVAFAIFIAILGIIVYFLLLLILREKTIVSLYK